MTFEVLYEDPDLLCVNKPEGLATIPERDRSLPSLVESLGALRSERLWVVHRLDKEVSGLVVFARNAEAHRSLSAQFEERGVTKVYLAVVRGVVKGRRGTIEASIRAFGSGRMGVDPRGGKASRTDYRVIEPLPRHTLLEVRPHTGRRHQIRVHLYHGGFPIAGDLRYGERAFQTQYPRLLLHAASLSLTLPDERPLRVTAPQSQSFEAALAAIREGALGLY